MFKSCISVTPANVSAPVVNPAKQTLFNLTDLLTKYNLTVPQKNLAVHNALRSLLTTLQNMTNSPPPVKPPQATPMSGVTAFLKESDRLVNDLHPIVMVVTGSVYKQTKPYTKNVTISQ